MRFKILSIIAVAGLLSACAAPGGGAGGAGGAGSADSGYAPGSQEDLAVNVGDRVHFDFDKYS
ncbi:MAG: peptidoglycan-associated lipoprotein, partial [Rhodospirillaceae bacterium]|nr:peptidoglycan-associated lipoprotein [Rhodospirillaceae bacterium]